MKVTRILGTSVLLLGVDDFDPGVAEHAEQVVEFVG